MGNTNPSQPKNINLMASDQHWILNAANTPFGSIGAYKIDPKTGDKVYSRQIYPSYYIPSDDKMNGTVTISESGIFLEPDKEGHLVQKSRASVVFHELSENYYRVQGQRYIDAHKSAVAAQEKFQSSDNRRSINPGVGRLKK